MTFTYLYDVRYQIKAHYERDAAYTHLPNANYEHDAEIRRIINMGGCNMVSIGRRECVGFISPCEWKEGEGYYDEDEEVMELYMFREFLYDKPVNGKIEYVGFANQKMIKGIIDYVNQPKIYRRYRNAGDYSA